MRSCEFGMLKYVMYLAISMGFPRPIIFSILTAPVDSMLVPEMNMNTSENIL